MDSQSDSKRTIIKLSGNFKQPTPRTAQEIAVQIGNLFGGNGLSHNEQIELVEEILEEWKNAT
jgi:hypothetical protein